MNIKKTLALITLGSALLMPSLALAQSTTPIPSSTTSPGQNQAVRINNLKTRANTEIDRRVGALNNLIARVNRLKKLSDADKASFVSQIQTNITNLNNLKTKIASDTDLTILKADVKSIVDSYRIFALFIPKIHLLAAADTMTTTTNNLNTLATKLQSRINDAQKKGQDTTAMQASLVDMQSKIADANQQYQNVQNLVLPLIPDGYPGNSSSLQSARTMLQTGRADLKAAGADAKSIIQALRNFKPSPSASKTS